MSECECGCDYLIESLVSGLRSDLEDTRGALNEIMDLELSIIRNNQLILSFPELQSEHPIEGSPLSILLSRLKAAQNKDEPLYSWRERQSFRYLKTTDKYPIDLKYLFGQYLDCQVVFDLCSEFRRPDIKRIWESLFDESLFEPWKFESFTGCGELSYYIAPISKDYLSSLYAKINKAADIAARNSTLNASRVDDILAFVKNLTNPSGV